MHLPIPGGTGVGIIARGIVDELVPEKALQIGAAWLIGDLLLFYSTRNFCTQIQAFCSIMVCNCWSL